MSDATVKPRRATLTERQRSNIRAAWGKVTAAVLASEYGVTVGAIHNIWQGRSKGTRRTLTDAVRETIIAGKGAGRTNAELVILSGFSECTVKLVLRDARDEGDMRAHTDPAVRAAARKQRAAAKAAHREGSALPDAIQPAALAPNSLELSLIMRGIRPEMAVQSARAWRDRHAQQDGGRGA